MTWVEWQKWRESRRATLHKYGCEAPSRRQTSFNTSERFMRAAFGGGRIPLVQEDRRQALEDDLEWIRRGRELCERKS